MPKPLKYHKTRSYIRERLVDPRAFDPDTFRIKRLNAPQSCTRCNSKRGHLLVVAKRPGSDTTEVQAILHPKSEEGKLRARAARKGVPFTTKATNPYCLCTDEDADSNDYCPVCKCYVGDCTREHPRSNPPEFESVVCTKCGAPLVYHARVNTAGVKGVLCYKCSKCERTFIRNGGLRQFQVA